MHSHRPPVITSDHVEEAGRIIDHALEHLNLTTRTPAATEQLKAANRETDPIVRARKKAAALKKVARQTRAASEQLRQRQREAAMNEGLPHITPEAEHAMEMLKADLKRKINRRAEEEMARIYPEQTSTNKRRAPRRHRINV